MFSETLFNHLHCFVWTTKISTCAVSFWIKLFNILFSSSMLMANRTGRNLGKKDDYSGADVARFLGINTSAVNRLAVSEWNQRPG
jgi:hypothetical protein